MDKELLLYNYFAKQLSAEDEKQFESLLASDAEFKAQFEFEKNLKEVIRKTEKDNLKAKLVDFEKGIKKEPVLSDSKSGFRNWSVAASIALLMGLGWFGYNSLSGTNYQDLYTENYQAYPNTVYTITRSDDKHSIERDAFVAYESGDYETAAMLFSQSQTTTSIAHSDFYLAQSYLRLQKNEEAIELFAKVILEDSEFEAEANWYLALAYLKEEDKANAVDALQRHLKKYDFNKAKAENLLKFLN